MKHWIFATIFLTQINGSSFCAEIWNSFTQFPPLRQAYHPVSTKSKEAQEAFDRGLTAIYAFNYDEALRSFDKASQHDPDLAMAYWGMALALDENLDLTSSSVHARLTTYLCQKAIALSGKATLKERAYINALKKRFSEDPNANKHKLREAYAKAMKKVVSAYPDDLDAVTLYAESLMDILYWDIWESDGSPRKHAKEIIRLLESVIKENPYHLGANHYHIHALEESPYPERALMSAYRLTFMDVSDWGHLLHTPSHIFMHVGYYEQAVEANLKGIKADKKYIETHGLDGKYPLKFLSHNLSFLTMAYLWQERNEEAIETAKELETILAPYAKEISFFAYDTLMSYEVYLYFHKWKEILELPEPSRKEEIKSTYWTFAQAMAYTNLRDFEKAKAFQELFQHRKKLLLLEEDEESFNSKMFGFADTILQACLAKATQHLDEAIQLLEKAAAKQTNFFDFSWFHPISQTLGAALLEAGRPEEAETFFRKALDKAPRNGRLLLGLAQALKDQGKENYSVTRESKDALKYASKELTLNDL
jgi:Flp pilus assembly protein TadD